MAGGRPAEGLRHELSGQPVRGAQQLPEAGAARVACMGPPGVLRPQYYLSWHSF